MSKPIILTFVAYYLPGYKSGGPVRTIANLVDNLSEYFDFRIVTADRDATDTAPYENVKIDGWNAVGDSQVLYLSPKSRSLLSIAHLIRETPHDIIYLNSLFNPTFSLWPLLARRLGLIPNQPIVLAPRGELSPGALELKEMKKRFFLRFSKILGLYSRLTWQASSDYEMQDIIREFSGFYDAIRVAPNLPADVTSLPTPPQVSKARNDDRLRVCFVSRISPKKNLLFALKILSKVSASVVFDIYGPIRDEKYWAKCLHAIKYLPDNIYVKYNGGVEHEEIQKLMAAHDLFFLPTLGENYGHVIAEALSAGVPVLIADTTPWRNLHEEGVGWDLSLDKPGEFIDAIHSSAAKSQPEYDSWRNLVKTYASRKLNNSDMVDSNRLLFMHVLKREE